MMKINVGLIGILVVIILVLISIFSNKLENEELKEELIIIKSLLEDVDNDIHEIEETLDER